LTIRINQVENSESSVVGVRYEEGTWVGHHDRLPPSGSVLSAAAAAAAAVWLVHLRYEIEEPRENEDDKSPRYTADYRERHVDLYPRGGVRGGEAASEMDIHREGRVLY